MNTQRVSINHVDHLHIINFLPSRATQDAASDSIAQFLTDVAIAENAAAQKGLTPPALGEVWPGQGGIYIGTMPARNGQPAYHLIAADPKATATLTWGSQGEDEAGAKDHYDGKANTAALLASGHDHPAAKHAAEYTADGHNDFYLPAHNELMLAWITAPQIFRMDDWYWTSTQYSPGVAWAQYFKDGLSFNVSKGYPCHVLPARRLIIQ